MGSLRVLILLFVSGCGGSEALMRAQMTDLQKRFDETQRRAAAAEHKAEDLQDQVFMLTDKLESQKVAAVRSTAPAPRLPVVLLKPDAEAEPVDGVEEIAFEGPARSADPTHARPQLVLSGQRTQTRSEARTQTQTDAQTQTTDDNLGVAPAPPINKSPAAAAPKAPAAAALKSQGADPLKLYRESYEALRAGRHDDAARGFRELVRRFPEHDLADNAQYWLGECFYDRKRFAEAMPEFRLVVTRYPLGNKAPDALLKLAFCLLAVGDAQKGRDLLKQVPESYPHTEAARLAELRLAELGRSAPMGGTQ